MKLLRLKKTAFFIFLMFTVFFYGCGIHSNGDSTTQKPTSITITRYEASNKANNTTFTVKGKKMNELYRAIKKEHAAPKNATFNCPSYSTGTMLWDYHIVIRYPDHTSKSYTQTTNGCTFLKNDQTGVNYFGKIPPSLSPFGTSSK